MLSIGRVEFECAALYNEYIATRAEILGVGVIYYTSIMKKSKLEGSQGFWKGSLTTTQAITVRALTDSILTVAERCTRTAVVQVIEIDGSIGRALYVCNGCTPDCCKFVLSVGNLQRLT